MLCGCYDHPETPQAPDSATLLPKTEQVLEDEMELILGSGWSLPGMTGEDFRLAYRDPHNERNWFAARSS